MVSIVNRDRIIKIIKLGRIHFVVGGFLLYCLGALYAMVTGTDYSLLRFILGYAVLFPAHLSVSYSNDYFDYKADKYNRSTMFSGGSGILVNYPELRKVARNFSLFLIFLSIILALFFLMVFSFPLIFLAFVIFGNLLGWFYSAPPVRLVYRKMGELATVLTAGILLPGMGYFVMKGAFDISFLIFALPLMLYSMFFILSVEMPDMEGDILGNKQTMIVRKGRAFGFTVMALCLILCTFYYIIMAMLVPATTSIGFFVIGLLSILPLYIGLVGLIKRPNEQRVASKLTNKGVASLFLFVFFVDIYYLTLLL
ncbi:MAG: prenyltransferase [Thermoplasmata archaeon]|nr:MAG: prenyltransferase [Thermoplasmata archaeon]